MKKVREARNLAETLMEMGALQVDVKVGLCRFRVLVWC